MNCDRFSHKQARKSPCLLSASKVTLSSSRNMRTRHTAVTRTNLSRTLGDNETQNTLRARMQDYGMFRQVALIIFAWKGKTNEGMYRMFSSLILKNTK